MRAKPLVALTISLVATLAGIYVAQPWLLARYYDIALQDPSNLGAEQKLEIARATGGAATRLLARTAGDRRSELAAIARAALLEEIEASRLETTESAAAQLIRLSAALAEHAPSWHATTRASNAELARRILSVAGDHFSDEDRERIVAHCETILRATYERTDVPNTIAANLSFPDTKNVARFPTATSEAPPRPISAASFDAPLAQFPGGGLPIDRAGPPVATLEALTQARTEAARQASSNARPADNSRATTSHVTGPTQLAPSATPAPLPLSAASPQLREMPRFHESGSRKVSVGALAAAVAVRDASRVAGKPDSPVIALAQKLHSPADVTRAQAHAELRALGYAESHIDLLHSVTDPDADKRSAAARALPVMRGMDARPWLLWLSFDDEEDVRHAALSVLATSYDPALVDRMRMAANADAAPRVRRLAETYLTNLSDLRR